MPSPLIPCRESCRWVVDGFTAVQFPWRRDVDDGSPRGEFLVGNVPRRVWLFGLASIKSAPLLGLVCLAVAHLHRRTQVGRCLPPRSAHPGSRGRSR